jgi:hypothetical protein
LVAAGRRGGLEFPARQETLFSSVPRQGIFSFPRNNADVLPLPDAEIPPNYPGIAGLALMKHFEPFGETVSWRDPQPQQSRALKWVGCGIFWLLAGTIVVARAAYFNPDIYPGFDRAIAFAQHLAANIRA